DAAEVGKSKSEFLRALLQVQLKARTLSGLKDSAGVAERSIVEAQAALDEAQIQLTTARQALVNLGFSVNADELRGLTAEEAARRGAFLGRPPPFPGAHPPPRRPSHPPPPAGPPPRARGGLAGTAPRTAGR